MRLAYWLNLLLFFTGTAGSLAAANLALPSSRGYASGFDPAFQNFMNDKDAYDVVFAGTSYIAIQIDPVVFDARCAELGLPVRSINLASPGSTFYEIDSVVRRILEVSPRRLRYIIMDPRVAAGAMREDDENTARSVRWHTPLQTWRAVRWTLGENLPPREKARAVGVHLRLLLRNAFPLGQARAVLTARAPVEGSPGRKFAYGENGGGVEPDDLEHWNRILSAYRLYDPEQCVRRFDLPALDAQIALLLDHGIVPIFLAGPTLKLDNIGLRALAASGRVPHVIFLDDPAEFPEFYEHASRSRVGVNHIAPTRKVVGHYTSLVAERFVEVTRTLPPAGQPSP